MTLAERLARGLEGGAEGPPDLLTSDHAELDERPLDALTPAAVLIAVTDRPQPGVILTQRTETLRRHAGQIAFPGGRLDAGEDAVAAALREAEEEIGLARDVPTVVAPVEAYRTVTGYAVTPVLATIPADLTFSPSADEVAAVFEVPLAFLLDPANCRESDVIWRGHARHVYEWDWEGRRIWGATAAMIVNLRRRLARW